MKFEKWSFGLFVIFGVNLRFFFFSKTAIIATEKPTGQQNIAMLSVFNLLILEVLRN